MSSVGVIVIADIVCGAFDLISTSVLSKLRSGSFVLLQFIGSGVFGESSFKAGRELLRWASCFISLSLLRAAAVYCTGSRSLPILVSHAFVCGIWFGILIYLFMSFIVIPLSAASKRKYSARFFLSQLAVRMFVVVSPSLWLSAISPDWNDCTQCHNRN